MAPKKKASKKKGGSGSGASTPGTELDVDTDAVFTADPWVKIHVKLVTWQFLNFEIKLRLSSRVLAIEEKIRSRHGGSVGDLVLYKGDVDEENLLADTSSTLADCGFEGGAEGEEPTVIVWYDFGAHSNECPLLMTTPRTNVEPKSPYRSLSRLSVRSPSPGRSPSPRSPSPRKMTRTQSVFAVGGKGTD